MSLGDYQEQPRLSLHFSVREATIVAVLAAAYFEPDEVVGVVGYAHLVRFGVTHTDARF